MNTRDFLEAVLPPVGEYYILSGKSTLRTSTVNTLEGAVALIEAHKKKQENVFIGLAGFKPKTDRKKHNVLGKKCFYIDLDVGDDPKKYASKKEAYNSFKDFLKASGFLVPSMVVDSGGGLHMYWLTNEIVVESEWTSAAQGLKQLAAQHGLKHDVSVCSDSSRILRVPNTFNWKDPSSPKECKVIHNTNRSYDMAHIRSLLPKESNVVPLSAAMFPGAADSLNNIIASTGGYKPRHMKYIIDNCGVAKHTLDTHGAGDDYNQWFAMLTLLLFCEDGEVFVHPFSNGHKSYSAQMVTNKWRSRQADKEINAVHGATTCETFHSMHPEICEACPHWKSPDRGVTWNSPLFFGLPPTKEEVPFPYVVLSTGNTAKRETDEDGGLTFVHAFDGHATEFTVYDTGNAVIIVNWVHVLSSGRTLDVVATAEELADQRAFNKTIARALVMDDNGAKELRKMAQSWAKAIQARRGEVKAPLSFGWTKDGKRIGFRHANTVYWSDGSEQVVSTGIGLNMIAVEGSYEKWREMVQKSFLAKHLETEVIIAAAFAAPLIAMSHIEGAILSAVSLRSGTGKTTAMRLGQAVWGHPNHAMFSLSDTPNSIFHRMGRYANLPAMWDDLRIPDNRREARTTVDMIYQITQGREKSRMTSNVELRDANSWKTLLICSSNTGLAPYIELVDQGGSAAQHRMLEFEVSPIDAGKACDPSSFNELGQHFGHAGILYVKWLLANYDTCKAVFQKNREAIQTKVKARPEDRFTVATIAAIYSAAQFASSAGIVTFDKAGILKFLLNAFESRRVDIARASTDIGSENSVVEVLAMYVAEHQLNTVLMKRYPARGARNADATNLISPAVREALMSIAIEDAEMRINKSVFDKWARQHGRIAIGKQLTAIQGISVRRRNVVSHLFGATGESSPWCYTIRKTDETASLFSEVGA